VSLDAPPSAAASEPGPRTALALGLIGCPLCGLVCRAPRASAAEDDEPMELACPRCDQPLHARKPNSVARTWAFLLTAVLVYLPANTLPIMNTRTLFDERQDTIMSGVFALWGAGSWELALVVFVASVVVPLVKMATLAVLLLSVQFRLPTGRRRRTRMFAVVEWIGQWSMLDVFVVVLMVALVQFSSLARIEPGPGAAAFGAVVVLTMLAAQSFDPRLIWDAAEEEEKDDDAHG
jgi:paraquat-inducible protein A